MTPTVHSVTVRGLTLTPARPVETANGVLASTPLVLVDVRTSDGVAGHSYLRCYSPVTLVPLVRLLAGVGELITGEPAEPAGVAARLAREFRLDGTRGLTGTALAGLDLALWDARARAAGLPLVTVLGGTPGPVPAYASLRGMRPGSIETEAAELLALGFTAFKIKVGGRGLDADLAAIRTLRRVAGDGCRLMVDYNQSLTVAEAVQRARILDGEGLHWIEEPTRADDVAGHARIAAAATTAVQLGENWWGPDEAAAAIAARACDHAMLDVARIGGVTGWLAAAQRAAAAGLPVSSHAFPEVSSHLLGVTPNAHYLEYLDHAGPVLAEPVRVRDGHVVVTDRPGSGVEWDSDRIGHATRA